MLAKQNVIYNNILGTVQIPAHPVIEYVNRATGEVLLPGPHPITDYIEIDDRLNRDQRSVKIGNEYYLYNIEDDYRFWTFDPTPEDTTVYPIPLQFTGQNTFLEVMQSGTLLATLYSGQRIGLEMDNSYNFNVIPMTGYEFDRPGQYTYAGATNPIQATSSTSAGFTINLVAGAVSVAMSAVMLVGTDPDTDPGPYPDPGPDPGTIPGPGPIPGPSAGTGVIGFNNVYIADLETLNLVSDEMLKMKRYLMNGNTSIKYDTQMVLNPHQYIINTIQLPFAIPTGYIANRKRITLGFTELFPSAYRLNSDKISLDLGEIYTIPKYGNSYDFANTVIRLHLPYVTPLTIDPTYVVGQTIKVEYLVDAYSGIATINIRSSMTNNHVFYSMEVQIGNEVPFISMNRPTYDRMPGTIAQDATVIGNLQSTRTRLNNNTPIPFVEVIRNIPHEMDSPFNNLIQETVYDMTNLKGHIRVHQVKLGMTAATADEESQLRNTLAAGIIIK
jgi:hypothetical protein